MIGSKLRAFREKRSIAAVAVAREVGRSPQRISAIEAEPDVSMDVAERYLNAVLKLYGVRERVRIGPCISIPMGTLSSDSVLGAELQELLS